MKILNPDQFKALLYAHMEEEFEKVINSLKQKIGF